MTPENNEVMPKSSATTDADDSADRDDDDVTGELMMAHVRLNDLKNLSDSDLNLLGVSNRDLRRKLMEFFPTMLNPEPSYSIFQREDNQSYSSELIACARSVLEVTDVMLFEGHRNLHELYGNPNSTIGNFATSIIPVTFAELQLTKHILNSKLETLIASVMAPEYGAGNPDAAHIPIWVLIAALSLASATLAAVMVL